LPAIGGAAKNLRLSFTVQRIQYNALPRRFLSVVEKTPFLRLLAIGRKERQMSFRGIHEAKII
jgi:hypothetical protein